MCSEYLNYFLLKLLDRAMFDDVPEAKDNDLSPNGLADLLANLRRTAEPSLTTES